MTYAHTKNVFSVGFFCIKNYLVTLVLLKQQNNKHCMLTFRVVIKCGHVLQNTCVCEWVGGCFKYL